MDSPLDPGVSATQAAAEPDARMRLESSDIVGERLAALKGLLPEAFTEGKIDFEKFRLALGDHVETGRERYGLTWAGKADAMRAVQVPSTATLVPMREESVDWDTTQNVLVEGENLEVLRLLQKSYCGKVDMIYIDPPYNTGNDFIYPDDFRDSIGNYLRLTGQASVGGQRLTTNVETSGRFHSAWLTMMYPRLFLARNLLAEDGLIFISISDHEVASLRAIMDEVFGEENFGAQLIWKSRKYPDSRAKTVISTDHEYLLLYSRSAAGALRGVERDESKFSNPDNDTRGDWMSRSLLGLASRAQRPNLHYPIIDPASGRTFSPPEDTGWRYAPDRMNSLIKAGCILFPQKPDGRPREKKFRKDLKSEFVAFASVIDDVFTSDGTEEIRKLFGEDVFDFPKPAALLKRLIKQGTPQSGVVLDFFAGSGATAQAVLEINREDGGRRSFLLVQLPEPTDRQPYANIAEITADRIRKVRKLLRSVDEERLDLEGGGPRLDDGFRIFALTSSNFKIWNADFGAASDGAMAEQLRLHTDHVLPDRSQDDILFEILLKAGYPLSARIEPVNLASQSAFAISDGNLIICLECPIEIETLRRAMARDPKPVQVICLDHAFEGNDQLKTNIVLEMEAQNIQFRTV